jgi:transcriptional regulator with XRE-family HTH domain
MANLEVVQKIRHLARSGEARRLRERSGLSLREVASEIGVDASSLSRWETGATAPRAKAALRWAAVLLPITLDAVDESRERPQVALEARAS